MAAFKRRVIRLAINARETYPLRDILTGRDPQAWHGGDLAIEIALFDGDPGASGTALLDVSEFTSISAGILEDAESGELVRHTVTGDEINGDLNLTQWADGGPTNCHARFEFDWTEMALLPSGTSSQPFVLAIYGVAESGFDPLASGTLTVKRSGAPVSVSTYVGASSRIDAGRPYFLAPDGLWYPLTVTKLGGLRSVAIDPNGGTSSAPTESAVGSTWGVHNGQVHWKDADDSTWYPVDIAYLGGLPQVIVGLTGIAGPPNGTLTGAAHSVNSGRTRAHNADGDWVWLTMTEIAGVKGVQWSTQTIAG